MVNSPKKEESKKICNGELEELYAFISTKDNKDYVMGVTIPAKDKNTIYEIPLIGLDCKSVKRYYPVASNLSKQENIEFKVIRYKRDEDVTSEIEKDMLEKL